MKPQQILNKLAKYNEVQKVELSSEEPIKVEFAMEDYLSQVQREFEKGERFAKELENFVANFKQEVNALRNNVRESVANIEEIKAKSLSEMTQISQQAKKLGLDSSDVYKIWQKVNNLSSQSVQKLDRYFQRAKI